MPKINSENEFIARLNNPSLGHNVFTISLLSKALGTQYQNPLTKFTAAFDCRGPLNLEHFKLFLQQVQSPARLYIPLGLGGNHATALIVDINNNHSDILFFNSLGNSNAGHYYTEAQIFINAVREKFPKKNDYYINKKFQQLLMGDIFCGDWSIWLFEEAAKKPMLSLEEIRLHFENIKNPPSPQSLRIHHVELLESYFAPQEEEKVCQKVVYKLTQLTLQYGHNLKDDTPEGKQIKLIIDDLIRIVTSNTDKPQIKIQKFYTFLDTPALINANENSKIKNIDIFKKDKNAHFIKAIALIAIVILLTVGTGILPGLLIMGLVYCATGKHLGDLFKSEGELLNTNLNELKKAYQASPYGVFFQSPCSSDKVNQKEPFIDANIFAEHQIELSSDAKVCTFGAS